IKVWDLDSLQELAGLEGLVTVFALSSGGRLFLNASGAALGAPTALDAEIAILPNTFSDCQSPFAFSPDGRRIISACGPQGEWALAIWDVESGARIARLNGHQGTVAGCAFSPDGSRVVSASSDGTLKLWNVSSAREIASCVGHTDQVTDCAFS